MIEIVQSLPLIQDISPKDTMYTGDKDHYFRVGASALRCIRSAMFTSNRDRFDRILDFPCGHGRVARHLRSAFPDAQLVVADLDRDAVDFCAETFGAMPVYSSNNTQEISVEGSFDLIWCGSLLTHFDAERCLEFLNFFRRLLLPNGILIFTMHGRLSSFWLKEGQYIYGLEQEKVPNILESYDSEGFGYLDYPGSQGYGISVALPSWTLSQLEKMDDITLVSYTEMGWDNHQDVVACMRSTKTMIWSARKQASSES